MAIDLELETPLNGKACDVNMCKSEFYKQNETCPIDISHSLRWIIFIDTQKHGTNQNFRKLPNRKLQYRKFFPIFSTVPVAILSKLMATEASKSKPNLGGLGKSWLHSPQHCGTEQVATVDRRYI